MQGNVLASLHCHLHQPPQKQATIFCVSLLHVDVDGLSVDSDDEQRQTVIQHHSISNYPSSELPSRDETHGKKTVAGIYWGRYLRLPTTLGKARWTITVRAAIAAPHAVGDGLKRFHSVHLTSAFKVNIIISLHPWSNCTFVAHSL